MEFDYDVFDRLIAKRVDDDGNGVFERSQTFVYDGTDRLLVFDGGGSLEYRYLHGPELDEVLADQVPDATQVVGQRPHRPAS